MISRSKDRHQIHYSKNFKSIISRTIKGRIPFFTVQVLPCLLKNKASPDIVNIEIQKRLNSVTNLFFRIKASCQSPYLISQIIHYPGEYNTFARSSLSMNKNNRSIPSMQIID